MGFSSGLSDSVVPQIHSTVIYPVSEWIIKTDILKNWQYYNIGSLICGVRAIMLVTAQWNPQKLLYLNQKYHIPRGSQTFVAWPKSWSSFNSPIQPMQKINGSWRMAGYHKFNQIMTQIALLFRLWFQCLNKLTQALLPCCYRSAKQFFFPLFS